MSNRLFAYLVGGAAALAWIAPAAVQAAPGGVARLTAEPTLAAEKVADRSKARPRAKTKAPRVYGYTSSGAKRNLQSELPFTYGMKQPHEYPIGSPGWWNSMKSTGHIQ